MPFKKGQSGNPHGRKKGAANKTTAALKDMILSALDQSGGVTYLKRQATANPSAFLTLVGKVLPMTVGAEQGSGIRKLVIEWQSAPSSE